MLDAFSDPGAGRLPAPLSRRRVLTGGGRGLLALALLGTVAAACGFTQTRTNTTANTAAVFAGAICGLDFIELHG